MTEAPDVQVVANVLDQLKDQVCLVEPLSLEVVSGPLSDLAREDGFGRLSVDQVGAQECRCPVYRVDQRL